jgi:electron transport complex protein RnfG
MDNNTVSSAREIILPLVILAVTGAVLLTVANYFAREKIEANAREARLRVINTVMPLEHDNQLYDDYIEISEPGYFGTAEPVTVFRARMNDQPAGIVFMPIVAKGYNGNIRIVAGIAYDGTLLAVRVLSHQETEGLGDGIDHNKSDWINIFSGLSLQNTPPENWTVKNDGGSFDQLSGATITSRGVINAVRKSLEYYKLNRDRLY